MNKKIERAKKRLKNFSAKGDKCPICHKDFRHGCNHSVEEAKERLFREYINVVVKTSLR